MFSTGTRHPLRGQGAGQGGPPQPGPGPFHRAHGGQWHPQLLAPAAVESALGHQHPVAGRARLERHQSEGLGGTQFVSEKCGEGTGAPIDRAVAADHQRGSTPWPDGGGQRAGQLVLVGSQFPCVPVLDPEVGRRDPQHRGAEGGHVAQYRLDRGRPGGHGQQPARPRVADAQRVLECGLVGGGEADAPRVPAHRAGERIDLRPQVGDPQAGHHQGAVLVAHRCTHPWWKTTP